MEGQQPKPNIAQWLEHRPANWRVVGSILCQGQVPGLQVQSLPPVGVGVGANQLMCLCHIDTSLSSFPPHPSILSKISEKISALVG